MERVPPPIVGLRGGRPIGGRGRVASLAALVLAAACAGGEGARPEVHGDMSQGTYRERAGEGVGEGAGEGAGAAPLEVRVAGCRATPPGPACARRAGEAGELRLWAAVHPDRRLDLEIDGAPWDGEVERAAVDAGQRLRVRPPAQARELALVTPGRPAWRLALVGEGEGDPEAAAARAEGDAAFRAGALREALGAYERAFDGLAASGRHRDASDVALTASFACSELLLDFACADAWLSRHAVLLDRFDEAEIRHTYYRGLLAERRGDLRGALADYRAHAAIALRLGLVTDAFAARSAEAVLRGRVGDLSGSSAALEGARALADGVDPREQGRLLNNAAWTWILARERGLESPDPRPLLVEALAISGPGGPRPEPSIAAHVQVNLALAELQAGDRAAAGRHLDALGEAPLARRQALWRGYVEARALAVAGASAEAARRFGAVEAEASRAGVGELRVFALVGRGLALADAGRREEALAAYLEAERALDRQLGTIAVDGGRERFAAAHDRSAREAVSLLVGLGRPREALCVARLARTRTFEAIARLAGGGKGDAAARDRQERALTRYRARRATIESEGDRSWSLPRRDGEVLRARLAEEAEVALGELDAALAEVEVAPYAAPTCAELARPGDGEVILAYVRGAEGWLGFADDGRSLTVRALALPAAGADQAAWGAALLEPFAGAVAGAERVRVIASGALLDLPIHALPLGGEPLYARVVVAHALDLPRAGAGRSSEGGALVVAPPSNLAHAPAEVEAAVEALLGRDVALELLEGDAAVGAAVRGALVGVDLLHFVGHARDDADLAWDAALELAGGSSLTVGDLLALPGPAPTQVILAGCRTGLADPQAAAGGMSLAHALLVAGAEVVVATSTDVDDAAALAVTASLYRALDELAEESSAPDPVVALARALRALRADGAFAGGPATYRAWVR